ncbi:hypothetical protein HA402_000361 [Bradysia odoriphaga]|nr:hypothetical protein HA402_000361 [Bradysia odoriphaga]
MCGYHLMLKIIVLICAAGIVTTTGTFRTESAIKNADVIKEYHEEDNTTFSYQYYFDDGSIASQTGKFKVVKIQSDTPINTPDNKYDSLYGFGQGYIRFIIRRQIFEFKYDIEEDSATGILTYVSANGTVIEEPYHQTTTEGYWYYALLFTPEFQHKMIPFNGYSIYQKYVNIVIRFPSNANHVTFGCQFNSRTEFNDPALVCKTFENIKATTVGFTANEADEAWIREQDKLQEK